MFISITELRCKNIFKLPKFINHSIKSTNQVRLSNGLIDSIIWTKGFNGYTITAWDNQESMKVFRNSGVHKIAMRDIRKLSNRYRSTHFEAEQIPSKEEAYMILNKIEYHYI